jgi:hypothetical protein
VAAGALVAAGAEVAGEDVAGALVDGGAVTVTVGLDEQPLVTASAASAEQISRYRTADAEDMFKEILPGIQHVTD